MILCTIAQQEDRCRTIIIIIVIAGRGLTSFTPIVRRVRVVDDVPTWRTASVLAAYGKTESANATQHMEKLVHEGCSRHNCAELLREHQSSISSATPCRKAA